MENKSEQVFEIDGDNISLEELISIFKESKKENSSKAVKKRDEEQELKPYQAELIKLQTHIENTKQKMIILFEGRDAAGKGGTIRRVTRYMNEKHYRVVALGKPSYHQKTELHMKRYIEQFPHAGELVLFDRSWYNRAIVEPIFNFCSKDQYNKFIKSVNTYERNFLSDGKTTLIKLYFSVSKDEQDRRFQRRKNDPLRQWKLSEVDLQAQSLWDEFTKKKFKMLKKTSTADSPWWVIRSDDKHLARLETMKIILKSVRYRGRSRKIDFSIDSNVVISGKKEIQKMKKQKMKHGKYVR